MSETDDFFLTKEKTSKFIIHFKYLLSSSFQSLQKDIFDEKLYANVIGFPLVVHDFAIEQSLKSVGIDEVHELRRRFPVGLFFQHTQGLKHSYEVLFGNQYYFNYVALIFRNLLLKQINNVSIFQIGQILDALLQSQECLTLHTFNKLHDRSIQVAILTLLQFRSD